MSGHLPAVVEVAQILPLHQVHLLPQQALLTAPVSTPPNLDSRCVLAFLVIVLVVLNTRMYSTNIITRVSKRMDAPQRGGGGAERQRERDNVICEYI